MSTNYPAAIDTPNNIPTIIDNITPLNAAYFNDLQGAIFAIEGALGVNPAGVYGTVAGNILNLRNYVTNSSISLNTGDLGGTNSVPLVIGIRGYPVSGQQPQLSNVLTWTGSAWTPTPSTALFVPGGDLSGNGLSQTVIGLQGRPISSQTPTTNYVLTWNGSVWLPSPSSSNFIVGGNLSGSSGSQIVIAINNASVPTAGSLSVGNILQVNGSSSLSYAPLNLAGGSNYVSGSLPVGNQSPQNLTLTGDVTGSGTTSATTTTVTKIHGSTVPIGGSLTTGNILQVNGGSSLTYGPVNLAGGSNYVSGTLPVANLPSATVSALGIIQLASDLGGSATSPSVLSIHGATVPVAGSLTTGNVLQVSGGSTLTYGSVDLAGGPNYVSGVLPAGNQAAQTMLGDVTGTTGSSTVIKLQNNAVQSGTLGSSQDGYVLTWHNVSTQWQALPPTGGGGGSFTAGGDLTGNNTSQTVVGLQGRPVSSVAPTNTQVLTWNGAIWAPATNSGGGGSSTSALLVNNSNSPQTLSDGYQLAIVNSTTGTTTVNMPANPTALPNLGLGIIFYVMDDGGQSAVNNITVSGNGNNIEDPNNPGSFLSSVFIQTKSAAVQWTWSSVHWKIC